MKTYTSHYTTTGNEAIKVRDTYSTEILILNDKRQIVHVTKNYTLQEALPYQFNLAGTQAGDYIDDSDYYNFKTLRNLVYYASKKQELDQTWHYENPIYNIVDMFEKNPYHLYDFEKLHTTNRKLHEANEKIALYRKYGTESPREIAKIELLNEKIRIKNKKKADKEATIKAKVDAKELKAKARIAATELRVKIKDGYTHVAVLRNYAKKGKIFVGFSLSFRKEQPRTNEWFSFNKATVKTVSLEIAKYY